jgi:ubiquinone/menaquinone biosynthesis C-methylase UbiE
VNYIKKLFDKIRSLAGARESTIDYWNRRARDLGERAVVNMRYNLTVEEITAYQEQNIFPVLQKELNGEEKLLLDFGCGSGRFTNKLARLIHGKAIGADPIRDLLDIARRSDPENEYILTERNRIPLPDKSVDMVWICLVMGGVPDMEIMPVTNEIKRVLTDNGLLILIENTSALKNTPHWNYRTTKYYQDLFSFAGLSVKGGYKEVDEEITIFTGRK